MGKTEENISEIRKHFMELENEKYEISNGSLQDREEYVKSLYVQMLSTVVQYENDATEMQLLFLKRIVKGLHCELQTEDYMRKALDVSLVEVKEFAVAYQSDEGKYYFALNAIILSALGERSDSNYTYLAELIQILGINTGELKYLSKVAESVLLQSSEVFDEAKEMLTESMGCLDVTGYIRNFYAGAVVDDGSTLIYSAPEKQVIHSLEKEGIEFYQRKIIFSDIEINVNGIWEFHGCEEVRFENCTINGGTGYLLLQGAGKFYIKECKVHNFRNSFALMDSVGEVRIDSNEFVSCGRVTDRYKDVGGVFYYVGEGDTVWLERNFVQNCYIKGLRGRAGGPFWGMPGDSDSVVGNFVVENNTFVGCACIGENSEPVLIKIHAGRDKITESGNIVKGGVKTIIDDY